MAVVGKAERSAKELLAERSVSGPPVPVEEIARELGVTVLFERFDQGISGILYRDGAHAVIGVEATHPKTRQRFTIAHEIGHLRLHKGPMFVDHSVHVDRRDEKASLGIDPDEIEANSFAAALLMPEDMIFGAVTQSSTHHGGVGAEQLISRLARRFDVSAQAMEYRLANLGLVVPPQ
jgi:Zn-dependent peptidase ImmA (M78 family)